MNSAVAALLKSRTAATHARVEATLGLLDGRLDAARLTEVLVRFAGFWPVPERAVDRWAGTHPEQASDLSWARRRRGDMVVADLRRLGLTGDELAGLPEAPPVLNDPASTAGVFGWLYVSEGSTLGGAVIDRALRRDGHRFPISTFTPYAEGPGPMWRSYLQQLAAWVGADDLRATAVADAAQGCFDALASWLAPLERRSVA